MSKENANQPMFPTLNANWQDGVHGSHFGLTKREYFAAMLYDSAVKDCENMMQEHLNTYIPEGIKWHRDAPKIYAMRTVEMVDALLTQLSQNKTP